ncbi:MAG: ATP-binding protein [Candidatus Celaenobacter antarcticus]|nr:ATP-binding protein [Candidatus Celaenobacter antarcticus]
MKLPSFKLQIIVIMFILLVISGLFTRYFFMTQFNEYSKDITSLNLYDKVHDLYGKHKNSIDKEEVSPILIDINKIELTTYLFRKDMTLYSTLYVVISGLVVLIILLIFLTLITRPLNRLQEDTKKIASGDLTVRVRESRFSPINELIVSFNNMVDELESSRDKLLQAEKDMMWREMAQVMAHEIKNPLTPLRLSTERMEMKYWGKSENFDKIFQDSMEVINEEINNLQHLVKEFSKFARMPSANFEEYDINEQIRDIIPPYRGKADITLTLDPEIPQFFGDKMQMKQVFVNLIQNAIQAMPARGIMEITSRYENGMFIFMIKDSGEGISPEDMERIFRPYYTTKEKGTGLGLSIVKRMINQHQGAIEVDSKKGEGTIFIIKINLRKKDIEDYDENFSN